MWLWSFLRAVLLDSAAELRLDSAGTCGGWATAAVLGLVVVFHAVLLLLLRRRSRRLAAASTPTTNSTLATNSSSTGIEKLISDVDLRELIASLDGKLRQWERWEHVISKKNDKMSYRAWCEKTQGDHPKYLSVTTFEGCSSELLRDFYMDNEYRKVWDNTLVKHEQLQVDDNSGIEIGCALKKFPFLTPREYVLAWRVWEANDKVFYCFTKDCEHPLVPRKRKSVRVKFFRSGWCIRNIPGKNACEITTVYQEDNGMNIEMAKLAFSKGIWSFVCKMHNALQQYSPQHRNSSASILTTQRLIKKVPAALEAEIEAIGGLPGNASGASTNSGSGSNLVGKEPMKMTSREFIGNGLLLVGSIVCLSRGRCNLGAQLAMAFFLKKAFCENRN